MSIFSRRKLFAGFGGLVTTAAASEAAPRAIEIIGDSTRASFGPAKTLMYGSIDLHPRGGENPHTYISPGGVAMGYGGQVFCAGIKLPVGVKLVKATLHVDPNGHAVNFSVNRYNPLAPEMLPVKTGVSTAGIVPEAVTLKLNHVMLAGWNYRFDDMLIYAGQAVLYGILLQYQEPV